MIVMEGEKNVACRNVKQDGMSSMENDDIEAMQSGSQPVLTQ